MRISDANPTIIETILETTIIETTVHILQRAHLQRFGTQTVIETTIEHRLSLKLPKLPSICRDSASVYICRDSTCRPSPEIRHSIMSVEIRETTVHLHRFGIRTYLQRFDIRIYLQRFYMPSISRDSAFDSAFARACRDSGFAHVCRGSGNHRPSPEIWHISVLINF